MCQYHECILLDNQIFICKARVQLIAVLVNDIAETNGDIPKRDDDVTADTRIFRRFQDFEKQLVMIITKLRANTQEFAECERRSSSKGPVLLSFVRLTESLRPQFPHLILVRTTANVYNHWTKNREE